MIQFEAVNQRTEDVELFTAGAAVGRIAQGDRRALSAPAGDFWEARDPSGAIVAVYQVSDRVPEWTIPSASIGLPVALVSGDAGPWNESLTTDPRFLRSTGSLRAVMLFVDFPGDEAAGQPWANPKDIAGRVVGDADRELRKASFQALTLSVDTRAGWLRMSQPAATYADPRCGCTAGNMRAFIEEAAGLASGVDFSRYDIVYVVAAKSEDFLLSPAWVADPDVTRPDRAIQTTTGEIRYAVTFGKDSYDPLNETYLLLHETYHLLGLPDLYDGGEVDGNGYSHLGLQEWDLMASQEGDSGLFGWHRLKLGWLDPSQVICVYAPGSIEVDLADGSRPEGVKAIMVPVTQAADVAQAHLAYVVEVASPRHGGPSPGVLVYSVNARLPTWERPIQMRGGSDALSAQPLAVNSTFRHLNGGVSVEVISQLPSGGFRVLVQKE